MHAGPGTGKTYLINAISQNLERHGLTLSSCALTGVASENLPVKRTMHSTFGFKRAKNAKQAEMEFRMGLSDTKLENLRSRFQLKTLGLFVFDEITMIGKLPTINTI